MYSICIPYRELSEKPQALEKCLDRLYKLLTVSDLCVDEVEIIVGGTNQVGKFNRAAALNEAIAKAKHEWIITMDVDLKLPPGFFEQISSLLVEKWVLGFTFIQGDGLRFPGTPGGVNVFHKKVWETIGGYCEDYAGYGYEDYDFRNRIDSAGFQFAQTSIQIMHLPHPQVKDIFEDLERNKKIYLEKWPDGILP